MKTTLFNWLPLPLIIMFPKKGSRAAGERGGRANARGGTAIYGLYGYVSL